MADLKDFHLTEVNSLREQIVNLQRAVDALKATKEEACKAAEDRFAEMDRLKENHNSVISQLGEAHATEISKLKDNHATEISKLKEDHAAEISGLKEKHDLIIVNERTTGYNEALSEVVDEIGGLKDRIYRGGYKFGLENFGLSCDHELFKKVVLCLPRAFIIPSPTDSEEEGEEKEDEGDVPDVSNPDAPPPPPPNV